MLVRVLAALAPLAAAPLAQSNVIVVGPPGPGVDYASLDVAIQASTPGAILLLKSGNYAAFDTGGRAIHIVADSGATPQIGVGMSRLGNVAAGSSCSLRGLSFHSNYALGVADNAGSAWIEECHFDNGVHVEKCASTGLARCTTSGFLGYPGLRLIALPSNVCRAWSFECAWRGGVGNVFGTPGVVGGQPGSTTNNSSLYLSGGSSRGGDGGVWMSGSSCLQGAGGQGANITSNSVLRHIDVSFEGGVPSTACGLPPIGGEPLVSFGSTVEALAGTARSLVVSSPVREGQLATVDVHGAPGEYALVVWGQDFQVGVFTPEWRAPLLVAAPQHVIALGVLPASGDAQLSFTLAELGAGVEGARAVAQGAFVDPLALSVQLGSASELVALDAGL